MILNQNFNKLLESPFDPKPDKFLKDSYLTLRLIESSEESARWITLIANELWLQRRKTGNVGKPFAKAVEAILAGLLYVASSDPERFCYRPMSANTFTDEPIGHTAFKAVMASLEALEYIEIKPESGCSYGDATRFRGTLKLFDMAAGFYVDIANFDNYFNRLPRLEKIKDPLVLKSSSVWKQWRKIPGRVVPVDLSQPEAAALAAQVDDINRFFAGQVIEPDRHHAFKRVFNQGDIPGFSWNKGGRLISVGDSYQQLAQIERREITLNGEAIVELDIRASHLTILHARLGVPFDPADDPYMLPGVPRHVAKSWVTMTLGFDRFQTRWSDTAKGGHIEQGGGDLTKEHPIERIREMMLRKLPVLVDWPSCSIRWGDLQFLESKAIVEAVHKLAIVHGIPALPVHDSLIVPISKKELCLKVLNECFLDAVGVGPVVCEK